MNGGSAAVLMAAVFCAFDGGVRAGTRPDSECVLEPSGEPVRVDRAGLFNRIDGAAELILELGFRELSVQSFGRDGRTTVVESYRMDCPDAALGLFLARGGDRRSPNPGDGPWPPGTSVAADPLQWMVRRGQVVFVLSPGPGGASDSAVQESLARRLAASVKDCDAASSVLDLLDTAGPVAGTERIVRGPVGLSSVFTFGPGDPLLLAGSVFGAAADYRDEKGRIRTGLWIEYPDTPRAKSAMRHLEETLDPLIRPVLTAPDTLVFTDFEGRFGSVVRVASRLSIRLHLGQNPRSWRTP
jgi:hypothetical protein